MLITVDPWTIVSMLSFPVGRLFLAIFCGTDIQKAVLVFNAALQHSAVGFYLSLYYLVWLTRCNFLLL